MKRYQLNLLCFLLFYPIISTFSQKNKVEKIYNRAFDLKTTKPDSAIFLFDKSYTLYLKEKDTTNAIQSLFQKAFVYETNAKYAKSYDALWKAMLLMDNLDNDGISVTH